ncbi:MAG: long-chain fatty acid--CoA ligase [Paludibacteraceae bacterium]|nr:long-chain fatty acid--CoA ligase [Paludibacteraceae bacterium]
METHYARMIAEKAEQYGDKVVLRYQPLGQTGWESVSWKQFAQHVDSFANALIRLGVEEGDRVGQYSQNMPENFVIDFALYSNRAIVVPIYATSSPAQVEYIVNNSEMRIIVVGEQQQYDAVCEVIGHCPTLEHIIVIDPSVKMMQDNGRSVYYADLKEGGTDHVQTAMLERRRQEARLSDTAAILYTSGTTGNPKGVVLTHEGFIQQMENHDLRIKVSESDVSICFLPITHVLERTWCYYLMHRGAQIVVNLRPQKIQETIRQIHPTMMTAVPRFWEKVYIGIREKLGGYNPIMLGVVAWAMAVGEKYNIDYLRNGRKPGRWLMLRYKVADRLIFSKVKLTVGIERGRLFPTAGASMSNQVCLFLRSIGIPICYGYGLTESYATVSCFTETDYEIGSIGKVMPNVQVRISDDGEILIKGKSVTPGYYKLPEVNKEAFTEDGYFRTGDAGYLKGDTLFLTERIKDLFKTSNGKYIAPQQIEMLLATDALIEQVAVIGDQRNYVTALIVPNMQALQQQAQANGWDTTPDALIENPEVYKLIESRIHALQQHMAPFEVIKKFTLIRRGFSIDTGELTNTLKLRRTIIQQKYAALIDAMYADKPDPHKIIG